MWHLLKLSSIHCLNSEGYPKTAEEDVTVIPIQKRQRKRSHGPPINITQATSTSWVGGQPPTIKISHNYCTRQNSKPFFFFFFLGGFIKDKGGIHQT